MRSYKVCLKAPRSIICCNCKYLEKKFKEKKRVTGQSTLVFRTANNDRKKIKKKKYESRLRFIKVMNGMNKLHV